MRYKGAPSLTLEYAAGEQDEEEGPRVAYRSVIRPEGHTVSPEERAYVAPCVDRATMFSDSRGTRVRVKSQ